MAVFDALLSEVRGRTICAANLPPRPECATAWRAPLLQQLKKLQLTLVIGQYAQAYHLPQAANSVTATVQTWRKY